MIVVSFKHDYRKIMFEKNWLGVGCVRHLFPGSSSGITPATPTTINWVDVILWSNFNRRSSNHISFTQVHTPVHNAWSSTKRCVSASRTISWAPGCLGTEACQTTRRQIYTTIYYAWTYPQTHGLGLSFWGVGVMWMMQEMCVYRNPLRLKQIPFGW